RRFEVELLAEHVVEHLVDARVQAGPAAKLLTLEVLEAAVDLGEVLAHGILPAKQGQRQTMRFRMGKNRGRAAPCGLPEEPAPARPRADAARPGAPPRSASPRLPRPRRQRRARSSRAGTAAFPHRSTPPSRPASATGTGPSPRAVSSYASLPPWR